MDTELTLDMERVAYMAEVLFIQYSGKIGESIRLQPGDVQDLWLARATSLEFLFGMDNQPCQNYTQNGTQTDTN